MKAFIVLAVVCAATAQIPVGRRVVLAANNANLLNTGAYLANQQYAPTPFEYAYTSEDIEGSHSAQQTGDGSGRVQGSYTITLADGVQRTVNYVADENGYRAEVTTNELGTESKNPADVIINSSAITGEQAAIQFGPQAPQRQVVARPAQAQIAQIHGSVALPSYGTFAGTPVARAATARG